MNRSCSHAAVALLFTACGNAAAPAAAPVDAQVSDLVEDVVQVADVVSADTGADTPDTAPETADADAGATTTAKSHVLLISIDGLHAADLETYRQLKPQSTLAQLAGQGIRYANAHAAFPSDSFPCVLAWATGGSPRTTGVFYDISWDRQLSPPGSTCKTVGTRVDFSEVADKDSTKLDGGGGFDPAKLPRDPSAACAPVYPHQFVRVNNIFEVVKAAGKRTAWADKHVTYEVLQGPSGAGVDDLFNPEIAAVSTKNFASTQSYDQSKVTALLNQIHGKDHLGQLAEVPTLFGMNFQAVSVVQKTAGYKDAKGTPSDALLLALDSVDAALGTLVDALKAQNLWDSTLLIVGASHGQSPMDPALVKRVPTTVLANLVNSVQPGLLLQATQDTVGLLWLADQTQTQAVVKVLMENQEKAGIDHVIAGAELVQQFGDPLLDARVPDLVVVVKPGTIYTDSSKKIAEHGGLSEDDRHVALLVVGAGKAETPLADAVETRQIAVTILQALGLDPQKLQAVAKEGTLPLPGLTLK